jgi:hypothetical protein
MIRSIVYLATTSILLGSVVAAADSPVDEMRRRAVAFLKDR